VFLIATISGELKVVIKFMRRFRRKDASNKRAVLHDLCMRSAKRRVCTLPRQNSTFGDRSFGAAGPRAWNELPFSIRDTGLSLTTFNAHLKTYLFSTVFEATEHL